MAEESIIDRMNTTIEDWLILEQFYSVVVDASLEPADEPNIIVGTMYDRRGRAYRQRGARGIDGADW